VGIARVASNGLNGVPTLYTTYNRAIDTSDYAFHHFLYTGAAKNVSAVADIKKQVAKLVM